VTSLRKKGFREERRLLSVQRHNLAGIRVQTNQCDAKAEAASESADPTPHNLARRTDPKPARAPDPEACGANLLEDQSASAGSGTLKPPAEEGWEEEPRHAARSLDGSSKAR
jgi:hypothetical protein